MTFIRFAALAVLMSLAVPPLSAAEKVFEGTLVCAKCYLKKPDAKACQDVLLVGTADARQEYYIAKNEVATKAGEACMAEVKATVTGTVSEQDGRLWLTPSKIEKAPGGKPHQH